MRVWIMRMPVGDRLVCVDITMSDSGRDRLGVLVLMVIVLMGVPMVMRDCLVGVLVLMAFGQVQPHSNHHEHRRDCQGNCQYRAHAQRDERTEQWRDERVTTSNPPPPPSQG